MNIEVHNPHLISEFREGKIVFKIIAKSSEGPSREVEMVTTKEDYERRLSSHQYVPILFLVSFYQQASYLYGCLNRKYRKSRNSTFVFLWRRIRTREWQPWFTVHPYRETMFEDPTLTEVGS